MALETSKEEGERTGQCAVNFHKMAQRLAMEQAHESRRGCISLADSVFVFLLTVLTLTCRIFFLIGLPFLPSSPSCL